MITLNESSKIYILIPAYVKTGGTELLHQLFYKLSKIRKNVYVVYENKQSKDMNCTPSEFKIYNIIECNKENIEYNDNNLLIIPEVYILKVKDFKKNGIKIAVWWLSVDNSPKFFGFNGIRFYFKNKGFLRTVKALMKNRFTITDNILRQIDFHLCQSCYAINFLQKQGIKNNVMYLSDYINNKYFEREFNELEKENIVLYNPKKGLKFTKKIMNNANFKWIPLENMSTTEVRDLLLRSKVYIDFGHHPGKDRFPREAAIMGCCIITDKKGSANFYEDVPIDDEFKFIDKEENIEAIVKKIENCLINYHIEIEKFDKYREWIKLEEEKFESDIKKIFI